MKTKHRTTILILVTFILLLGLAAPAWGQEDGGDDEGPPIPGNIPLNEYGTPDMDQIDLTLYGDHSDRVVLADLPLVGEIGLDLTYDVYADNYGNTWVVPDPVTIVYTVIYPEALPAELASRGDGWTYGSLAVGLIESLGGLEAMGITVGGIDIGVDPDQDPVGYLGEYLRAHVIEGGHWDFMVQMWDVLADAGSLPLWQLAIVYGDDPFDPTDDPTPPPTGTPQATGTPRPTATLRPSPTPFPTATPMPTKGGIGNGI